jgi:SNF2 family DNA or RNA helicase
MTAASITYQADTRRVLIAADSPSAGWSQIRRVCLESSGEFEDAGPYGFSIPWWNFLGVRASIGYHAKRSGVALVPDAQTTELLGRAVKQAKNFKLISDEPPLAHDEVRARLTALGFKRELTKEQLRNVCQLSKRHAAATFSVPGAGKTTEALAYFALKDLDTSHLVVIAPKNAFAAWEEQVEVCLPSLKDQVCRLTGGEANITKLLTDPKRILLVTYQQVPTALAPLGAFLSSHPSLVFLDESHRMKRGTEGVIGKAILSLSHLPHAKLIMSGTPLPNTIGDLVPQFGFLYPEITADKDNVIDLVKQVYVRTPKSELGLRVPIRIPRAVPLTPSQSHLYTLLRSEAARQASGLRVTDRAFLRRFSRSVLRLLQLVSNPMLLSRELNAHEGLLAEILSEEDSPKIAYVCKRARQLAKEGKKTVIWSTFVENVELISERLADLGADYIHGGVEAGSEEEEQTREAKIKRFHDDKLAMVLVANPAACSEGISLHTVCNNAIYLDRNFNAAQYLQSEDRIHRLGLSPDQDTFIEIVYCPDTVDEVVDTRLRNKVARMADVLNDPGLNIDPIDLDADATDLDLEDVKAMISHLGVTT